MIAKIKIKKLNPNATIPTKGSHHSAGFDLYACIDEPVKVWGGDTVKVGTGIAIQPPEGHFGAIYARSGLATKHGLRPANAVGICDFDYTGEYIVALHNDKAESYIVQPGERIAQVVFQPYLNAQVEVVSELDETERGNGGFGSTGK